MTASNALHQFVRNLVDLLTRVVRQARELQLQNTTAALAFLSLLAIVPIFSIVLVVLAAMPVFESLRDGLQSFLARNLFLPAISDTLLQYLTQFAGQASQLSMAGAGVFFATALGCLLTIDRTLNRIWGSTQPRSLAQRLTLYWSLLTVAPLILGASIAVNGVFVSEWLRGGEYQQVREAWFSSLPWVSTALGLLLLYRLVPTASVRWRDALVGALVATVLMQALRDALGLYLTKLPTYTVIYGAFSVLPLLLLWLFLLWLVVLLGALFAANLRYWGRRRADLASSESPARAFSDALLIVRRLAETAPQAHGQGLAARLWRDAFADDSDRAERAVRRTCDLGYVDRMLALGDASDEADDVPIWREYWSLAEPADQLSLARLFAGIWGGALTEFDVPALQQPLDRWARMLDDTSASGPLKKTA